VVLEHRPGDINKKGGCWEKRPFCSMQQEKKVNKRVKEAKGSGRTEIELEDYSKPL
jgi:hypothetical protein